MTALAASASNRRHGIVHSMQRHEADAEEPGEQDHFFRPGKRVVRQPRAAAGAPTPADPGDRPGRPADRRSRTRSSACIRSWRPCPAAALPRAPAPPSCRPPCSARRRHTRRSAGSGPAPGCRPRQRRRRTDTRTCRSSASRGDRPSSTPPTSTAATASNGPGRLAHRWFDVSASCGAGNGTPSHSRSTTGSRKT